MDYLKKNKKIIILYIGIFITTFANMVEPMLTILLQKKFSLTAFQISLVLIIQSILLLIASILGGILADYCNRKYNIIICDSISAILFIICVMIPFSLCSVLLIILGGAFQHMELASYNTILDELVDEEDQDKGFALYFLFWTVGALFSSAIAGFFVVDYTKIIFITNGIGVLFSSSLILFFFKYTPKIIEKTHTNSKGLGLKVFKMQPILIWLLLAILIYEVVHNQYVYMLPMETNRIFNNNGPAIYGTMISVGSIFAVLLTTIITNIVHKKTHIFKLQLANFAQGLGFLTILIGCITIKIPFFYIGFLIFTVGEIFSNISYTPYLMSKTPDEYKGRINGIFSTTFKISAIIFNPLIGVLYDKNPYYSWGLMGIVTILSIFIISHINKLDIQNK